MLYIVLSVLQCRHAGLFLDLPHEVIFIVIAAVFGDFLHLEIRMGKQVHGLAHACIDDLALMLDAKNSR